MEKIGTDLRALKFPTLYVQLVLANIKSSADFLVILGMAFVSVYSGIENSWFSVFCHVCRNGNFS